MKNVKLLVAQVRTPEGALTAVLAQKAARGGGGSETVPNLGIESVLWLTPERGAKCFPIPKGAGGEGVGVGQHT